MRQHLSIVLCLLLVIPAQRLVRRRPLPDSRDGVPEAAEREAVRINRILKAHPRFDEDFRLPKKVRNEEEWLIGRACYWPDVARSQPEYNRTGVALSAWKLSGPWQLQGA